MKAWEKLLSFDKTIGFSCEMVVEICKTQSKCPAAIESKYHLIGDRRLEKFCSLGCSVECVNCYMDIKVN